MSGEATSSQGSVLYIGDGGGPETFNAVGDVTNIGGPSGSASILPASDLDSTHVEKAIGLLDEGQVSVEGHFAANTDTYQAQMRTDRNAKTLRNMRIIFSNGEQADFACYIMTFNVGAQVDTLIAFESTLEITGAVTWS